MVGCEFAGCDEREELVERKNVNNGLVYQYCEDHAPAPTGHNWTLPNDD